mgnify:CR=1 FL=1
MKKNLHQIWYSGNIPDIFQKNINSLKNLHPDWNYKLWDETACRNLIKNYYNKFINTYDSFEFNIQRIDVAKLFILDYHGGLYSDLDIHFYKNIESLINNDVLLFNDKNDNITNSIFYNNKSYFFNKICKQYKFLNIISGETDKKVNNVLIKTGPIFLTNFYKINKFNFNILDKKYFEDIKNTNEYTGQDHIYGIHEYSNTWFDKDKVVV